MSTTILSTSSATDPLSHKAFSVTASTTTVTTAATLKSVPFRPSLVPGLLLIVLFLSVAGTIVIKLHYMSLHPTYGICSSGSIGGLHAEQLGNRYRRAAANPHRTSHHGMTDGGARRHSLQRLMALGSRFGGFSTITSPRSSMYLPNMFGALRNDRGAVGVGGSQERLLVSRDEEEMAGDGYRDEDLEMNGMEDCKDEVVDVMHWHGTNTLNTSWGWMV